MLVWMIIELKIIAYDVMAPLWRRSLKAEAASPYCATASSRYPEITSYKRILVDIDVQIEMLRSTDI